MKKFYFNEEEITEEEFNKQLEGCIAEYIDNNYDDLLDEENEEERNRFSESEAEEKLTYLIFKEIF